MEDAQLKAIELEHSAEYYKGNPVINGRHVISAIHNENPDVVFPQIPKLMGLRPSPALGNEAREDFSSQKASFSSTSSHTPPQEVLSLCPDALNNFVNKTNKDEHWRRQALHYIKEDYGSQTPKGGLCRYTLALAYEKQPFLTPREVFFMQYASMPRADALRYQTNLKSSEADAFILNHEVGHRLWYKFGHTDKGNLSHTQNSPEFQALKYKKDQINFVEGGKEPYGRYLEEAFCDTFASLQHLKKGGSPELLKTISDAREHGFMNNTNAYIYPTHSTIRPITKNPRILQEKLVGTNQEDVARMAARIVGDRSYDREEYYEHAMVAQAQAMTGNRSLQVSQVDSQVDWEKIIQDEDAPVSKLWRGYCSSGPTGFQRMFARTDKNMNPIEPFVADAFAKHGAEDTENYLQAKHRLTNAPEAKPAHHRAELLGHLKYVASKYPEKMPKELLREREAYLRERYKQFDTEVPEDIKSINRDVSDHLAGQRAASLAWERLKENEKQTAAAITKGESPTELEQHQPHELER